MPVINGSATGETLNGTAGQDSIFGLGGDDSLFGFADADLLDGGDGSDIYKIDAADSPSAHGMYDSVVEFISGADKFDLSEAGTADNYIEKGIETIGFADAMDKALKLLVNNDGLKDYVFIANGTRGWLFGELTDDFVFDLAVEIENGRTVGRLDFADII
jgi:Ca2+-binding RTX toxin-like protein